jgi:hypothetical protein
MTGIPSHLSLPPFDVWRQDYLMTNSKRSAVNGTRVPARRNERSLQFGGCDDHDYIT